jgi:hypothetical protein
MRRTSWKNFPSALANPDSTLPVTLEYNDYEIALFWKYRHSSYKIISL